MRDEEEEASGKILVGKPQQPPPVLFALLHPLDDFTRVVNKQGGRLTEWREDTNRLVFTSSTSSLAVSFNTSTDQHTVWGVRRANQQEAERGLFLDPREGESSGGVSHTPSSRDSMKLMGQSCSRSPAWLHSSSLIQSPSLPSRGMSPASRGASPQPSRTTASPNSAMANLLRGGQSPNTSKVAARFGSPVHSPRLGEDISMLEEQQMPQPVEVTTCLDHLWTEPCGSSTGQAEKIFLATDCVGQQMICLLSSGNLVTVKMERTNDAEGRVIFGAARRITALDAVPVPGLNMLLVLESPACLALYTGSNRVCVVAIPCSMPSLPTASLSREISALALDSAPSTPVSRATAHLSLDMASAPSTPLNAKKSSLLTSSRPPSATLPTFGEALSPVAGEEGRVVRLRDAISRSLTLVYSTGRMVQVTLPDLGSPLVCSALAAVKVLLPRDLALLVHSSWYTARHAPGPPPSPDKEWRMFQSCLLSLAGYQVQYRSLRLQDYTIISDRCTCSTFQQVQGTIPVLETPQVQARDAAPVKVVVMETGSSCSTLLITKKLVTLFLASWTSIIPLWGWRRPSLRKEARSPPPLLSSNTFPPSSGLSIFSTRS